MKKPLPTPWPPILSQASVPWHVRVRDAILTLAVWVGFIHLTRGGFLLLYDYFSAPIFQLTRTHTPDWLALWNQLHTFAEVSMVTILWLVSWGFVHRHRLRLAARATPPTPLPPEKHAADLGVELHALNQLGESKSSVVELDDQGRIKEVRLRVDPLSIR